MSRENISKYDLLASQRVIHVIMSTLKRQTFTVDDSRLLLTSLMWHRQILPFWLIYRPHPEQSGDFWGFPTRKPLCFIFHPTIHHSILSSILSSMFDGGHFWLVDQFSSTSIKKRCWIRNPATDLNNHEAESQLFLVLDISSIFVCFSVHRRYWAATWLPIYFDLQLSL